MRSAQFSGRRRFTSLLLPAVVVLTVGGLAAAGPASAADLAFGSDVPTPNTIAPGTTAVARVVIVNDTRDVTVFADATAQSVTFTAGAGSTFPAQASVPSFVSSDGGATWTPNAVTLTGCVASSGGVILTCTTNGSTNTPISWALGSRFRFDPQVTVAGSVPSDGATLPPGSAIYRFEDQLNTPDAQVARGSITIVTPDAVAPAAPVVTDPGPGASGPTTGTAEPGSTVEVRDASGAVICSTTATTSGTWSCSYDPALPVGTNTLTATATDAAGNSSPATAFDVVVTDTTAPGAPAITSTALASASGPLEGTAEPGSTVTVRDAAGAVLCIATADDAGDWSCTLETALPTGASTISVTAEDPSGNISAPTSGVVTVAAVVVTPPGGGSGGGAGSGGPGLGGAGDPGSVLASTGSDPWPTALAAILLLVTGLGAVVGGRLRRGRLG